ncbi:dipeptide epimerase [Bacillus thuringiensis]|uniref:Dipeptide epimerase n=7 Tax=Bacillus cereus group TaxID=86661 RepID=A0A9X0W4C0_BACCE|nr:MULTISPECIES: dipeptide epimerase [Bacillus]EAO51930.1 L-Ala-D/L-Glu racemase [Bacillus thuringiensis serovar israelensis ATCC 35646]EEM43696.1 Mandelate racemase/muconate lactonizing enzyme family protein [Bacillus thuringiensis serovar sotto str. T04001]MED1156228.1 dipeptide epimerase [Bacillus paranthracis]ACK98202.1 mandelate racemase/muconate lactonizing enzyme family protein [Bacillus cereus G9842]AFQ17271.1 mandelate racemase/muconate lactonizing protein [Bacillus thuringiensis HD-7
MKITAIHLYAIRLPLRSPFVISYGSYSDMPSIIVKMETDEGIIGYGEGVADDHVTGESWESTFHTLKHTLTPALIGKNPMNIEKIHDMMDNTIYGVPTAKAAIDIACFDIMGKKLNQPVYQLIGGRYHEEFPVTHVLSIADPEDMAEEAASMIQKGYQSFKMKVGTNVKEDVKRIEAVRERVGNDIAIRIDVNQGWKNSANTLTALRSLGHLNIDWIEQPVIADDIDAMAHIRSKTDLPLMIDEGLKSSREMRQIIKLEAADKVNIKLMKCGGIYPAVKLAHQAEMAGIECQVGSMVESSVASSAGFHVAFSKKIITSVELTGPLKFTKDIGNLHYDVPFIRLNEKPGLGIEINEDTLQELTVFQDVVR